MRALKKHNFYNFIGNIIHMKNLYLITIILCAHIGFAQSSDTDNVKATIDRFFEGFHKQDSLIMLETIDKGMVLQTIGKNREGKTVVRSSEVSAFLKSIASIPKDKSFKEDLTDYNIQVDGDMAHAWTPYYFYFDKNFSHCGVNSFQLVRKEGEWKIIYLVDTRRKDCRVEED